MISIRNAVIAADVNEASYVKYGVLELRQYLGQQIPILERWDESAFAGADCILVIGSKLVEASPILPLPVTPEHPGPEGFGIRVSRWQDKPVIAIAGSDPQGTKYGIIELMKQLRIEDDVWKIPADFERWEKPHFTIRAMYGHLHWQYSHPYACRSWSLEDWKSYVDLLTYFGANVLQLWPMLCMLPDPLSPEDEQYLRMFDQLADYAWACRGMELWVGECCNNVALSDGGVDIAKREYFGNEKLLDPGNPVEFKELMSSRENLYRTVPHASGNWIIDSDPGFWKGSPASDFVRVFIENQKLMKRYNVTDKARMLYWMQWSWGTGTREENWTDILGSLQEQAVEPWNILMGTYPDHAQVVEKLGLMDKVIFFPYGSIEPEPSVPMVQHYFPAIRESIEFALDKGFTRAMGQAQTVVVQLPNIYYFLRCLWNPEFRHQHPYAVLTELGELLYPQHAEAVAAGWHSMIDAESDRMFASLASLQTALGNGDYAERSLAGRFLFGNPAIVPEDLFMQMEIRANGRAFYERVANDRGLEDVKRYFRGCVEAILCWRDRHDYFAMGGWKYAYGPAMEDVIGGVRLYEKKYGDLAFLFDVEWPVKSGLFQERRFHPGFIDGVLTEIRSQVSRRVTESSYDDQ